MKFTIALHEGPYNHQAADSAYNFIEASLARGHQIERIFFYHDGVNNASARAEPPQDDRNIYQRWSKLGSARGIDIVICIAAAKRRGVVTESIVEGVRISGLGQLVDATLSSERLVIFG